MLSHFTETKEKWHTFQTIKVPDVFYVTMTSKMSEKYLMVVISNVLLAIVQYTVVDNQGS